MAALSFRQMLGVPASTASPSDSTLLIIDAENEYAEGQLKVSNVMESRKVIASLLQKYRAAGGQVVHIVHNTPAGAPVMTPNTKLAEEFEELAPNNGEKVIGKQHPSSFAGTTLDEVLGGKGKIVLTGYMAHVCVSTTARDAARMGYDVIIAEDAVGDRDIPGASGVEVTTMVMKELGDAFGTIVKSSEIK
ncbi:phospholipase C type enzyme [Elasticomyces elasticus]|nr:phospholipase C type enzyme [Elasticomyces elasticus]